MEKITREEFVKKAIDMLARNELKTLPSKMKNRLIFLYLFVQNMDATTYTEKEVNELIKATLSKMPQVYLDHVRVRRALIDYGFLERTDNGAVYTFSKDTDIFKLFPDEIDEVDVFEEIENYFKNALERKRKHIKPC
ncbi:MAG: DUF2087 domain-containing protein [Candidatus Rehaiarchaeum fermentans]|nr:DUF2087 domain-containing protein [Candidatus Rehaiarchaeum fermentans]